MIKSNLKKFLSLVVLLGVITFSVVPTYANIETKVELSENVVKNASFEDGSAHWKISADSAKVVAGVSHSGEHSLEYTNTDPDRYILFTQEVDVKPGQKVQISAWVKGKDISKGGAGVFIQSYGNGKYLYGSFPKMISGTFDWTQTETAEMTVPENATSTTVGVYLNRKTMGTAWFDDIEVRVQTLPAFNSFIQKPFYRNMVVQDDESPWEYSIHVIPRPDWKKLPLHIKYKLYDSDYKLLTQKSEDVKWLDGTIKSIFQPPVNLEKGIYTLKQSIIDPNGKEHLTDRQVIRIVDNMPKVYVDAQGFTVVDGERFFPLGLYLNTSYQKDEPKDEDLERIAKGGFNTITDYQYGDVHYYYNNSSYEPEKYREQIDMFMRRAEKHNLKVVYSLPHLYPGSHRYDSENQTLKAATDYVRIVRNYPSLLAWNTNDERRTTDKLLRMYNHFKELDFQHPTLHVQNYTGYLDQQPPLTDIIAPDPYPVGHRNAGKDLTLTSKMTDATRRAAQSESPKGVWVVPQIFDWHAYQKERPTHQPSLDEMRNQAYQALINGAKGLVFYSYFDLKYAKYRKEKDSTNWDVFNKRWADVSKMGNEIKQITPIILRDEKVLLALPQKPKIEAAAWKDGNQLLILLANPYYEENSVTFALPKGWKIKDANQGRIKSTFTTGKATFTLPSVGSGVFQLVKD